MGAQFDRLRYEVFQNLFLSPMNTGFLRPAVATAPTVYGIETFRKLYQFPNQFVATAPTVYGIETKKVEDEAVVEMYTVATAPTVYGIETIEHLQYGV